MQRAIGHPPVTSSEGIHFQMMEPSKLIRFVVTRGALSHLAGRPLTIGELEDHFYAHRAAIEGAASRKFVERGSLASRTTIDASDLATVSGPSAVLPTRGLRGAAP